VGPLVTVFPYSSVYVAVIVIRSMCQFVGRETSYKYVILVFTAVAIRHSLFDLRLEAIGIVSAPWHYAAFIN